MMANPAMAAQLQSGPAAAAAAAQAALLKGPAVSLAQPVSAAAYSAAAARAYTAALAAQQPAGLAAGAAAQQAQLAQLAALGIPTSGEYGSDPYLGHGVGPVAGYGASMYRGAYNRFAPY
ncbi:RNA binding protein fox-1 homolog 2-like [Amphibalanus amphitrite]|uniref:RNA binding protein fox-1 homolog 2-like n=1 Tax=Amphibalanus amphitrite TaxID=1232801 RepID=UPI001C90F1BA|nr:RNA binding protein fox-1 homolog 2-like [Amphibalanus amphitrite]